MARSRCAGSRHGRRCLRAASTRAGRVAGSERVAARRRKVDRRRRSGERRVRPARRAMARSSAASGHVADDSARVRARRRSRQLGVGVARRRARHPRTPRTRRGRRRKPKAREVNALASEARSEPQASEVSPVGSALLVQEPVDARDGVSFHHVCGHHVACARVGVAQREPELAVEELLAGAQRSGRLGGDLARE